MSKKILKAEDLMEISSFLIEKGFDQGITIEIAVDSIDTLKKINDDFFFRFEFGTEGKDNTEPEIGDDIIINIGGVKFRYFVKSE